MPSGAATTKNTSSTPTTSTLISFEMVTVTISGEMNVLVVGVLLVVFVVAAPDGILGLAQRIWRRVSKTDR